jgi:hypothetical protein
MWPLGKAVRKSESKEEQSTEGAESRDNPKKRKGCVTQERVGEFFGIPNTMIRMILLFLTGVDHAHLLSLGKFPEFRNLILAWEEDAAKRPCSTTHPTEYKKQLNNYYVRSISRRLALRPTCFSLNQEDRTAINFARVHAISTMYRVCSEAENRALDNGDLHKYLHGVFGMMCGVLRRTHKEFFHCNKFPLFFEPYVVPRRPNFYHMILKDLFRTIFYIRDLAELADLVRMINETIIACVPVYDLQDDKGTREAMFDSVYFIIYPMHHFSRLTISCVKDLHLVLRVAGQCMKEKLCSRMFKHLQEFQRLDLCCPSRLASMDTCILISLEIFKTFVLFPDYVHKYVQLLVEWVLDMESRLSAIGNDSLDTLLYRLPLAKLLNKFPEAADIALNDISDGEDSSVCQLFNDLRTKFGMRSCPENTCVLQTHSTPPDEEEKDETNFVSGTPMRP